jgi:putative ABC transport system substrate-binding protein
VTATFPQRTRRPSVAFRGWPLAVLWLAAIGLPNSAHANEIAILKSADIAPYNQAIEGFKANLPGNVFTEYDLQGDVARGRKLARKIRASDANLVLAVGVKAALVAKLELLDIPVIFCMVLDPAKHDLSAPNMTGILLEVPIERQLATMRSALPGRKKIGLLYDPEKTAALVQEARRLAKELNIELVERQVSSEKDVPAALRALLPTIEALWLVPDSTVLNEDSIKFLLNTALDSNVPVIGFSSDLVRSGALVGLSVRYDDAGRQAGLLAKRILSGQPVPFSTVVPPEQVRLSLNLKTASFLGISVPPDLVGRADEVY